MMINGDAHWLGANLGGRADKSADIFFSYRFCCSFDFFFFSFSFFC